MTESDTIQVVIVSSLKELWGSKEWKKRSKAFVEGKSCAWCGAKAGDTYTDRKGKTRKLGLSPHHIEKHKWALPLYKQVATELFNEWYKNEYNQTIRISPVGLTKREQKKQLKDEWINSNREYITEEFELKKQDIIQTYIDLNEEEVMPLCTRCHYAREKGLLICPECKTHYRKPKYKTCYTCSKEENQ